MSIRVVNLRGDSPCQAEPDEELIIADRTTMFGNPYYMKEHSIKEREKVINQYRIYLMEDVAKKGPLHQELLKIVDKLDKGKKIALGCHCAPLPCHCDSIKSTVEHMLAQNFRFRCRFHKDGAIPQQEATIFVFGSNEAGRHGKGAAKLAYEKYGAVMGKGSGLSGRSFAIPTKDKFIRPLSHKFLYVYVGDFIVQTKLNPNLKFFVTRVGAGLAGNQDKEMASLFRNHAKDMGVDLLNCSFAEEWKAYFAK